MYLITGGGSGIGRALARTLANADKDVMISGRREAMLRETSEDHARIRCCAADLSQPSGRETLLHALQDCASLSGVVHNAGTIDPMVSLAEMQHSDWQQLMATNVEAPLFLTQALLPKLTQGRVLNVGSGAAYFPIAGWGAYCTSKAALSMLTRIWQEECPAMAIASVMPGIIDTDMQAAIRHAAAMKADKKAFFTDLKQKGKLLDCDTVAAFMRWLLLDTSVEDFRAQEWDIYDKQHHAEWLVPPHQVIDPED